MKKLFLFLMIFGVTVNLYAADVWQEGAGNDVISGSDSPADIDTLLDAASTEPLERLLQDYREGCEITYASASTITVGDGQIMVENAAGTVRAMLSNSSNTTVTWSDIDTGSEASSTTYYLYAYCSDPTSDLDFDVAISTNSSTPSGITYYKRLGSFYNDSSSNILNDETITNDNDYYALQLGDWTSKSADTSYSASTDGYLVAYFDDTGAVISGDIRTDASNPPTTVRQRLYCYSAGTSGSLGYLSMSCPVKSGDYYKVTQTTGTATIYWLPLE